MTKYAIIEDNPFAQANLQRMISDLRPEWELVFCATTIEETLKQMEQSEIPNLFFMDIELADGRCFEIFDRTDTNIPVVFTTAYDEFALKAFKVNVVDYLLKPISVESLNKTIERYEQLWAHSRLRQEEDPPVTEPNPAIPVKRILTVSGDRFSYINLSEINYFLSEDNYIFAYLTNEPGRRMINLNNLTELEKILPADDFFRISRNVIASIQSVANVSKYFRGRLLVTLQSAEGSLEISVSSSRRMQFLRWLGG